MQITQETSLLNIIKSGALSSLKDFICKSDGVAKETALFYAARHQNLEMVNHLLNEGVSLGKNTIVSIIENCGLAELKKAIPYNAPFENKQEALLWAVEFEKREMVGFLLDSGGDPYAKIGKTSPFDVIERINSIKIAELILQKAPFNNKDKALLRAVERSKFEMTKLLLQNRGTLKNQDSIHMALVYAAYGYNIDLAKLLLGYGANPFRRPFKEDCLNMNAMDAAYYYRYSELIKLFEKCPKPPFELKDAADEMRHAARVWGIKHEWKGSSSEGSSFRNLPHTAIARALGVYIKKNPVHGIIKPENIIHAFALADEVQTPKTTVTKIQGEELAIISTGYPEHMITLIFFKNIYAVCQRTSFETKLFDINPNKMTEELLNIAYQMKSSATKQEAENFFYKTLPSTLMRDDRAPAKGGFSLSFQKYQKGGFCSWNSPEAALLTVLALSNLEKTAKDDEIPELLKKAKQIYKDSTTFFRLFFTNEYIDKVPKTSDLSKKDRPQIYLDYDLLEIIKERLESDWHLERFHSDYFRTLKAKTIEKINVALNRGQLCVMF